MTLTKQTKKRKVKKARSRRIKCETIHVITNGVKFQVEIDGNLIDNVHEFVIEHRLLESPTPFVVLTLRPEKVTTEGFFKGDGND